MTIQRAREILGEKGKRYTDEQIEGIINTLVVLSNIVIDKVIGKEPPK